MTRFVGRVFCFSPHGLPFFWPTGSSPRGGARLPRLADLRSTTCFPYCLGLLSRFPPSVLRFRDFGSVFPRSPEGNVCCPLCWPPILLAPVPWVACFFHLLLVAFSQLRSLVYHARVYWVCGFYCILAFRLPAAHLCGASSQWNASVFAVIGPSGPIVHGTSIFFPRVVLFFPFL